MEKLKIGVVVADIEEYKPLTAMWEKYSAENLVKINRDSNTYTLGFADILCINCGIGKVNAAAAATHLIDLGCKFILNFGLSGGISGVKRGEIIIADRFLEHDFDLTTIGYKPCEKPRQKYIYEADESLLKLALSSTVCEKQGTAVCGDRFICNEADRNFFKTEFKAMSCDMETAAIAAVCDMFSVPFIAMRRISDDAGNDAFDSYNDMNTAGETELTDEFEKLVKAIINAEQEG